MNVAKAAPQRPPKATFGVRFTLVDRRFLPIPAADGFAEVASQLTSISARSSSSGNPKGKCACKVLKALATFYFARIGLVAGFFAFDLGGTRCGNSESRMR
jgi:hypothetical protein